MFMFIFLGKCFQKSIFTNHESMKTLTLSQHYFDRHFILARIPSEIPLRFSPGILFKYLHLIHSISIVISY